MNDQELKAYVDEIVEMLRREMDQRQLSSERAILLATSALNHRLESMNEFRSQILMERTEFVRQDAFRWIIGTFFLGLLMMSAILFLKK